MSNPAGTRIVQNTLEYPGTSRPVQAKSVTIRLNTPAFIDNGEREKVRSVSAKTDANGLWSCVLEVNADIDPVGTYYTVQEAQGLIWSFIVPAGDPAIPVWLHDCLVNDPINPNPITVVYGFGNIDGGTAGSVYTSDQVMDGGAAA